MLAHTKKHLTEQRNAVVRMSHNGQIYAFPAKIAAQYRVDSDNVNAATVFAKINTKYTKPGALLRGIRNRENLTQVELAKLIKVTQSDISQMEKGTRKIGRTIAKRIEKLFAIGYREFLE